MKIFTRLVLMFLVVAVLPLALFGYFNLKQDEAVLRVAALSRVSNLADKKMIQVRGYLAERERNVRFLAKSPRVVEGLEVLSEVPGKRAGRRYASEDALVRQDLERYVEEAGVFYDLFLITPQGEIIYTQRHESDFATNLLNGPWRDTQLAEAFRDVRMTLEPVISRQGWYAPSKSAALFIAAPIMADGKFKGVMAAQLGNELFFRVASDTVGMGVSGEAVFARRDGEDMVMTTPLRYRPGGAEVLRLNLKNNKDIPMFSAISGQSGENVKRDYRGVQVVSAWRYLPELDWGMVVKLDGVEVFASVYRQQIIMLEALLALLFLSGTLAYYFARQISRPLEALARTAGEMAEGGSLDQRADESAFGELGLFAQAFNRMVAKLQGLYSTLEDRIEERTRELNVSNEQLQEEIAARKQAEEEIRNLAFYDVLTGLPNRRLLIDRLGLALAASSRSRKYGAVLFLDMDKFKTLNDKLGHDYGDLMLIEVARRMHSCVREADTVARFGGDEFVVLLEDIDEHSSEALQKVALIAEKIRESLSVPYQIAGYEHYSSPSIGVSLYLGHEESVNMLLKHADMAMYQAKDSGRNAVRFFDLKMQQTAEEHATLETDLRRAVSDGQLRVYYQIQVDNNHQALGAEALVRWMHPVHGMVSPEQFIPVAEESALILEVGAWVLETACQQLSVWQGSELTRHLRIAVNVSAKQFKLADFVGRVAAILRRYDVEASQLKLELTESVVLSDVADVVAKMHALKALGVRLSLDDFGTGYSSLSYLKQLPLDQIKIDQSFVRDIATDPNDAVMVQTIIGMAQNFRLNVIAEGVETEVQLAFLKKNGCMAYQGYLFSKPVPIEEFEKLLVR
jgi:diguanylate cyclase (GGDEF)-like protein